MHHFTLRRGVTLLLLVSLTGAGSVFAGEYGRNFDARLDMLSAKASIEPTPIQKAAIAALAAEVGQDLAVEIKASTGAAKSVVNHTGNLTGPRFGEPTDIAIEYAREIRDVLGLTDQDLRHFEVTDVVFSQVSGATHVYFRQTAQGIAVYQGQLHVNINGDGEVTSLNNAFVPDLHTKVRGLRSSLNARQALEAAAAHLGIDIGNVANLGSVGGDRQRSSFSAPGLSRSDIHAELFWLPVAGDDVRTVWNFWVETPDGDHLYEINVDAAAGEVLTRFDSTNEGSYRVYQEPDESPLHGSMGRTLVVDPEDATASPNGWFTGGTMDGNNVHACPDRNGNNGCDSNPQCSGTTCDFPINLSQDPVNFIPAAVANLFYWNNLIHDIQYQYGFDEQGGNFQENNFGRGGAGSDSVNADAQDNADGSSRCNANMSTPTDGGNPRMQMFVCNQISPQRDGDLDNGVIVHEYGHGISIRQVGGPGTSCLNNSQQAGEGWSDWLGLSYTGEPGDAGTDARGIGSYLFAETPEGGGIRDLPYSTSSAVNNWTYESISGASIPHGVGSRWAQAAWEVYWALVDAHGIEFDLVNFDISDPNEAGNKRAMFYINEGLKNTACSPTFVNNRDGIITAATNSFGGEDVCLLWETFAAFGLGTDAVSGGSNSTNPTNGFSIPASCQGPPPPPPPPPPGCSNVLHSADFEGGGADGWTNNAASTCSTGDFLAATPDGVNNGGVQTQVSGAASGTGAWFTATNGGGAGVNDVDGGTCDSRSPVISAGAGDVTFSFDFFHGQRDAGDDATDGMVVDVINASNGSVITTLTSFGDVTSNAVWTADSGTINLGSDTDIQLRIRVTDGAGAGDLVEGGLDNVQICGNAGGGPPPPPPPPPPGGGCAVDDDFESGAAGWFNDGASTCTTGAYVLGNPTQQVSTVVTQPAGSASGVSSIFTATNSSAGNADVDGGNCILGSPVFSVGAPSTLSVNWFHGQRDTGDDASGDFFNVQWRVNGGAWNNVVSNGDSRSTAAWTNATAQVPAGNVEVRVQCSDGAGPGDIIECGIDDISICEN